MARFRITYNAPVVLTLAVAAAIVQLLPDDTKLWFAAWPKFYDARSYVGLVSHVLGHANWDHLLANFTLILLIGPILEERHGSRALLGMIGITAVVTGLVNVMLFDTFLVGASGIVFMMILLASTANIRQREIPLTFIAVAVLYLGREIVGAFRDDQISQMGHLVGGVAGAVFGFVLARPNAANLPLVKAPGASALSPVVPRLATKPKPPGAT